MPNIYNLKKADLETLSIIDYDAFKYYRENNKFRKPGNTPNYVEHGKLISKFYDKVGEKLVESSGGVFIEGLGYFGAVIDPKINITSYFGQDKLMINKSTSGYSYHLAFIPIAKDNLLREWVADKSFSLKVRKAFSAALKAGKKYSLNFIPLLKRFGRVTKNEIV